MLHLRLRGLPRAVPTEAQSGRQPCTAPPTLMPSLQDTMHALGREYVIIAAAITIRQMPTLCRKG